MTMPFKLARAAAVGFSLVLAQSFCANATEAVTVFPDASRIATVGGSLTEIVYALGEQDRLVARDSTSLYPQEAQKLPDVGYMRQLSPEGVLSVDPSGILALQGSGPKEAIDVLKKASIPYVEVPEAFDRQGIVEKVRLVGKALGVDGKAEVLAEAVDARLKAAEDRAASIKDRKRVLFVLSVQGGKILASGGGTAADGISRRAGGLNAVGGYSGYKQLTDEAVITANPDIILMMNGGGPAVPDETLFADPSIAATPAGAARRVVRMDGGYLLGFGPRTADAVHDLAVSLYGQQIAD